MGARPLLGLSVPLLNEAAVVEGVVVELIAALEARAVPFALALVDNGSTDATGEIVDRLARDPRLLPLHLSPNQGYGGGILAGVELLRRSSAPEVVGWCWGDGQVDPRVIPDLYEDCLNGAMLAKARRTSRQGELRRRVISSGFALATRALGIRTPDVNGCPKLLHRAAYEAIGPSHRDWFLDTEVVHAVERRGMPIADRPAVMRPRSGGRSKVRAATILEFLRNIGALL